MSHLELTLSVQFVLKYVLKFFILFLFYFEVNCPEEICSYGQARLASEKG